MLTDEAGRKGSAFLVSGRGLERRKSLVQSPTQTFYRVVNVP
jgi:hypothetical protein